MSDIIKNTMNDKTTAENRLKAIKLYCEGVRQDFPETAIWMHNILILAGFEKRA